MSQLVSKGAQTNGMFPRARSCYSEALPANGMVAYDWHVVWGSDFFRNVLGAQNWGYGGAHGHPLPKGCHTRRDVACAEGWSIRTY